MTDPFLGAQSRPVVLRDSNARPRDVGVSASGAKGETTGGAATESAGQEQDAAREAVRA